MSIPGLNDTTYDYYANGRLRFVQTGERKTEYAYTEEAGFIESVTAPDGVVTYFSDHDAVGRPHLVEIKVDTHEPPLKTVGFDYDKNGNTTAIVTPGDIRHGFGFNNTDRNDQYDTPRSGSYVYKYDKERRLTQEIFPSAEAIIYDYDPGNTGDKSRLREIRPSDSTGTIFYDYYEDCGTKPKSVGRGLESVTYTYDGSLVKSEISGGTVSQTISHVYDNDGDFLPDSFSYGGIDVALDYDNDGLLTDIGNFTVVRDYDFGDGDNKNGLPWQVLENSAPILERDFIRYGETDREAYTGGADAFAWEVTLRDTNGRITEKTETLSGSEDTGYVYAYDDMGRLRTVTKDGELVEEYRYDEKGRRNYEWNKLRNIYRTANDDFAYDNEDCLTGIGSADYEYDADGFLLRKTDGADVTLYDYSLRGELLSVSLPDGRFIGYIHDPLGRRIAKKIDGTITEKYLWAGLTTLLAVYDGSDNLLMRFEYADGRMPVAMTKGGQRYYLAYDQVGSLRAVTDASGNLVKRIEYDTFGNILTDSDPLFEVPFGFAGGLHDRDTGLIRFGYRDYDPDTGRWTAKDPILFAGGDTDLYGYCVNDPVNWIDPLGLRSTEQNIMSVAQITSGVATIVSGAVPFANGAAGLFFATSATATVAALGPTIVGLGLIYAGLWVVGEAMMDMDPCLPTDETGPMETLGLFFGGENGRIGGKVTDTAFDAYGTATGPGISLRVVNGILLYGDAKGWKQEFSSRPTD
ncbi:hypothetical protein DENIS_0911 [Desulfonema ishimotonii]|uniref:Teneurin-like YD-shell domain-containing protein n=1 Tax=Desulfonema ishimotonii TaxID=45657 RepID=A0A401FSM5_9BACT|nr:RHS repeat-associated core domain-containing protein [Desulfonema ishimotonii]GBC59969.1 hypothetical protein DENIS_0911 [Desulfonema ishimotonii]